MNGFQSVSPETLRLIRQNLRAGLDRVAESLADGTFHTCGPKGSAPPAQSGRLTLALLDSLDAEIRRREEPTMDAIEVRRQILSLLDRWGEEHETSGCPAKVGECIHSAADAVRAVVELHAPAGLSVEVGADAGDGQRHVRLLLDGHGLAWLGPQPQSVIDALMGATGREPVAQDLDELIAQESARNPEFAAGVAATERQLAAQHPLSGGDAERALSERVNWDLIQHLAEKPHKHLNIVEGERYGLMVDGKFDTACNGVGEVMQEARTVQHLLDMAGVPEGWGYTAHIDARVFLLISDLLAARERLARIASWHSLETGPGGMVGLYCIECGTSHPCETRRMADGTHEDLAALPADVVDPAARDARVRADERRRVAEEIAEAIETHHAAGDLTAIQSARIARHHAAAPAERVQDAPTDTAGTPRHPNPLDHCCEPLGCGHHINGHSHGSRCTEPGCECRVWRDHVNCDHREVLRG